MEIGSDQLNKAFRLTAWIKVINKDYNKDYKD